MQGSFSSQYLLHQLRSPNVRICFIDPKDKIADVKAKLTCLSQERSNLKQVVTDIDRTRLLLESEKRELLGKISHLKSTLNEQLTQSTSPPTMSIQLFRAKSDNDCKIKAGQSLTAVSMGDLLFEEFFVGGAKGSQYALVVCNHPHHFIVVAGPDSTDNTKLRNEIYKEIKGE